MESWINYFYNINVTNFNIMIFVKVFNLFQYNNYLIQISYRILIKFNHINSKMKHFFFASIAGLSLAHRPHLPYNTDTTYKAGDECSSNSSCEGDICCVIA